jgi:hypothetical protein
MEQVFDTDLLVEHDMKTPCPKEVTRRVKNKSGNKVDRIDVFEGIKNITQINLGKKESEQNNSYNDCEYFCQEFRAHDFLDKQLFYSGLKTIFICFSFALLISNLWLEYERTK